MKNNDLIYEDMYYGIEDEEEIILKLPISSAEVNMKDKKCDYKTLAIMTLYSKRRDGESHRYIYKDKILLNKDEIEGLSKTKIDTICRNIKKLCKLSSGVIEAINSKNGIVYLINYSDENDRKYVTIEEKILRVLVDACSSNLIKTYILLKYRCKDGEKRITRQDIASNIGLSPNSKSNLTTVTNIIYALQRLNLIKIRKQYETLVNEEVQDLYSACYNYFSLVDYNEWLERYNKEKI